MLDGPGDALRSRSRRRAAVSSSARRSTVALPSSAALLDGSRASSARAHSRKGARSSAPSYVATASSGAPGAKSMMLGASRILKRERSAACASPSTRPPFTLPSSATTERMTGENAWHASHHGA